MSVVLPLLGCGAFEGFTDIGDHGRDAVLRSSAEATPKTPAKTPSSYVQSYGQNLTSASYAPATVQRASLAPLAAPSAAPAGEEEEAMPSGGFALGSVVEPDKKAGARKPAAAPVREANEHGSRRSRSQPYADDRSDYRAEPSDYAPQPRRRKDEARLDQGSSDYVVQQGDTLYAIAERTGMSVDDLMAANRLNGADIYPGQRLRVETRGGYDGGPYREVRPEPRGYREPPEQPRGPYRERADGRGAEERYAPSANVYVPAEEIPEQEAYQEPERYAPARRPARVEEEEERPVRQRERAYSVQPAYEGRQPEYTSSNRRFTPDGPFEPSPDAPWRGEQEWRRQKPRAERPEAYEPPAEPRYEPQRRQATPLGAYERQRAAPAEDAYEPRGPYRAQPVPAPRAAARQDYPAEAPAARGGKAEARAYVYTVQRGDTLSEVARRNGIEQRELAEFNGLPGNAKLRAGQELRIPRGEGYDWSHARPQEDAEPAPALRQQQQRPTSDVRRPAAPAKEARPAAAPVESAKPQPARFGKTAEAPAQGQTQVQAQAPAQRRSVERTAALAPEPVSEDAPPPRIAAAEEARQAEPVQAPRPAEQAAEVAMADPAPPTTTATAHAVSEATGPRECEALLASPEPRSAKTFRMPVQGMVVAKFGSQADGSFNDGINFSVPKGTPVKAAENGVVAYAGDELPGFGNLVLIRHADGYVTAYAHNDELLVRKCDVVKRGQIISKAGATGKATAPQLHFELRKDSKPMDPDGHFSGT